MDRLDDNSKQAKPLAHVGLCETCAHARVLAHPRGGAAYWRCAKSDTDKDFPKYPRLPVVLCQGYEVGTPQPF